MLGRTFGLAFLSSVEDFLRKLTYDNMSPQQLIATPVRSNAPDRAKPWGAHPVGLFLDSQCYMLHDQRMIESIISQFIFSMSCRCVRRVCHRREAVLKQSSSLCAPVLRDVE